MLLAFMALECFKYWHSKLPSSGKEERRIRNQWVYFREGCICLTTVFKHTDAGKCQRCLKHEEFCISYFKMSGFLEF